MGTPTLLSAFQKWINCNWISQSRMNVLLIYWRCPLITVKDNPSGELQLPPGESQWSSVSDFPTCDLTLAFPLHLTQRRASSLAGGRIPSFHVISQLLKQLKSFQLQNVWPFFLPLSSETVPSELPWIPAASICNNLNSPMQYDMFKDATLVARQDLIFQRSLCMTRGMALMIVVDQALLQAQQPYQGPPLSMLRRSCVLLSS